MKSPISADDSDALSSALGSSLAPTFISQQVSGTRQQKLIFKIFYEGDCKRITINTPIQFSDLVQKCIKNFGLNSSSASSSSSSTFLLLSEDADKPHQIYNQESLSQFLISQQQKGLSIIKVNLIKQEKVQQERVQKVSSLKGLSEMQEAGQQDKQLHNQQNQPQFHAINPLFILQILSVLQQKGQVTRQDVKLLSLQNSSLNTQEALANVDVQKSMNILGQCESIVSEIIQQQHINQVVKSEGDLANSQIRNMGMNIPPPQSARGEKATNKSTILQQSSIESEMRLIKLKDKEALPSLQEIINRRNQGNRSQRVSFFGDIRQSVQITSNRNRTNSGRLDTFASTPTGNIELPSVRMSMPAGLFGRDNRNMNLMDNQSRQEYEEDQVFQKALQITKNDQSQQIEQLEQEKKQQNLLQNQRTLKDYQQSSSNKFYQNDVTEDNISILSDSNNTILERNESLEISLALNDSQINQSYMK